MCCRRGCHHLRRSLACSCISALSAFPHTWCRPRVCACPDPLRQGCQSCGIRVSASMTLFPNKVPFCSAGATGCEYVHRGSQFKPSQSTLWPPTFTSCSHARLLKSPHVQDLTQISAESARGGTVVRPTAGHRSVRLQTSRHGAGAGAGWTVWASRERSEGGQARSSRAPHPMIRLRKNPLQLNALSAEPGAAGPPSKPHRGAAAPQGLGPLRPPRPRHCPQHQPSSMSLRQAPLCSRRTPRNPVGLPYSPWARRPYADLPWGTTWLLPAPPRRLMGPYARSPGGRRTSQTPAPHSGQQRPSQSV